MTRTSAPNRAICQGDQARAGVGSHAETAEAIQRELSGWTTPHLKRFMKVARSELWRNEAHQLLMVREGVQCQLRVLEAKRASRRERRQRELRDKRSQESP